MVVSSFGKLHKNQGSPRCLGIVSGFVLKLIRESVGLTQVRLAESLSVDAASVQSWESGRRPLAALRAVDLLRLRSRLLRCGAQPTVLAVLEDAIQADLIITEAVRAGGQLIEADEHPLGATVHQRKLTNLITWPFNGILPSQLCDLPERAGARRGPVPERPLLGSSEQTRFFDHLLVVADANSQNHAALLRRQAIYLLGFDARASTADWLHSEQHRALCNAGRTDHVPSWVAVRSSAVALANTGDRDPLRAFVQQALGTDQQEQANVNYWAYWVGEIDVIQVDDGFMSRIDPRCWAGTRLLSHLLERLVIGSGHTELNLHTVWALLATHPTLLACHPGLRAAVSSKIDSLDADHDLSVRARRELSDIAYAVRLACW